MKKLLKNATNKEELQQELTDYLVKDLLESLSLKNCVQYFFYHISKDDYLKLSEDEKESKINYYITDITYV